MAFADILQGMGEAFKSSQAEKLKRNQSLLDNAAKIYMEMANNPAFRPESQSLFMQRGLMALTHDPNKTINKELLDFTPFLQGVEPKEGQSLEAPGPAQQVSAPSMVPGLPSPATMDVPRPNVAQSVRAPLPPYWTPQELDARAGRAQTAKSAMEVSQHAQQAEATAAAQAKYRAPVPPDTSILPFDIWRRQNPDEPVETWIALQEKYKDRSGAEKGMQTANVVMKNGRRGSGIFFNPDPSNFGYFKRGADGKMVDVTDQVDHQYEQPPNTIRIENASNAARATLPVDISRAVARASNNLAPANKLALSNSVREAVDGGDIVGAREQIRQAVLDKEGEAVQNTVNGRRDAISSLRDIKELLKGVPTNLLRGTAEDTARFLKSSTNPKYVEISVELNLLNQAYRRSITGAAFSRDEAGEYVEVFPSYYNTAPVNAAQIDTLINRFGKRDDMFWNTRLGKGWSDLNSTVINPPTAPPGGGSAAPEAFTLPDGRVVRRQSDGTYK